LKNIDLAVECGEVRGTPEGVEVKKEDGAGCRIQIITVTTEEAAQKLGKPIGTYITIEFDEEPGDNESLLALSKEIAKQLSGLLPEEGDILFCGLGNRNITPDALGPIAAEKVLATRHLPKDMPELKGLRPVSVFSAGVLSQTGIETAELLSGVVDRTKPAAVVTADALAARRLSRLSRTVQISDTGIAPGSGVGNTRTAIDEKTLGCRVIAVGVPLVVDGATLACDLFNIEDQKREQTRQLLPETAERLMVTSQEIDKTVSAVGRLIALAFNLAVQPSMDPQTLLEMTS